MIPFVPDAYWFNERWYGDVRQERVPAAGSTGVTAWRAAMTAVAVFAIGQFIMMAG